MGPLRNMEIRKAELIQRESPSFTMYPVSLISDSNLSTNELYYLRYLFVRQARAPSSVFGTTFRYLWHLYNFNLSCPSTPVLRYSALARSIILHVRETNMNDFPVEHYEYMSRFLQELRKAINNNTVDEAHLFAVFLAIYPNSWRDPERSGAYYTLLGVFCAILQHLDFLYPKSPSNYLARHVWRYMLSYLRRICARRNRSMVTNQQSVTQSYTMHLLDMRLRERYDTRDQVHRVLFDVDQYPHRHCFWNAWDLIDSLRASFGMIYAGEAGKSEMIDKESSLRRLIHAIHGRTDGFEMFKHLDEIQEVKIT